MRIGFDAKRAFLNKAGLGNYSRNALVALNKYYPQYTYQVFTPEVRTDLFKEYLLFDIVEPHNQFYRFFSTLWRNFYVGRSLAKHNLDLFHGLTNELPVGIHRTNVPAIVTIHDLIFLNFPHFYRAADRKIYLQKVKYACKVAVKIIAISEQTRNDLISHLQINPSKIEVIYQSIAERFYMNYDKDELEKVNKKYGLPPGYVLSVGTIEQRKNQLGILKAIHKYNPGVPYVIVGKHTAYAGKIAEYIEANRLEETVFMLENVPDSDLPLLYRNAICLAYLSHSEGFGLPPIEAMASGCPVIASSVSCLPEIGGNAALYCDPERVESMGAIISEVLVNSALRKEMITKGKERAKFFHPSERVEALISLYTKVVKE